MERRWYVFFERLRTQTIYLGGMYLDAPKDLRTWINQVRVSKSLSPKQISDLNSIGFVWDSRKAMEEDGYRDLLKFREIHGHCKVPAICPEFKRAARFVRTMRRKFSKGELVLEKIIMLNEIGFEWDPMEELWHRRFNQLKTRYKNGKIQWKNSMEKSSPCFAGPQTNESYGQSSL